MEEDAEHISGPAKEEVMLEAEAKEMARRGEGVAAAAPNTEPRHVPAEGLDPPPSGRGPACGSPGHWEDPRSRRLWRRPGGTNKSFRCRHH